jgi:hypothetical protein
MNTVGLVIVLTLVAQTDAKTLLDRAIAAAGGAEALTRARVLHWDGKATIYAGERQINIEGTWEVEPPDRAVVTTWEVEKGKASTRSMRIDGDTGTMERDGKSVPMPPVILAHERGQFYLYSVLKLASLRDADVRLTPVEEAGAQGLLVARQGRSDVKIFFDAEGRPTRMLRNVSDSKTQTLIEQELRFDGVVESGGVRWPQRIRILEQGKLFFDLQISNFRVSP